MRKNKKPIIMPIVFATLLCSMSVTLFANAAEEASDNNAGYQYIQEGVYIEDLSVGNMTKEEATKEYEAVLKDKYNNTLTLATDQQNVEISFEEMEYEVDIEKAVSKAESYATRGNILKRYKEAELLKNGQEFHVEVEATFNEEKLREAIVNKTSSFSSEANDASITRANDEFIITPEKNGILVDIDKTLEASINTLKEGNNFSVEISREEFVPNVTATQLETISDLLGEYDTGYSGAEGRMQNVENAASFLNGQVVFPGEELSFYDLINPFSLENGYSYAGEYSNGKVIQGIGGGVCQVSTTFYNAVLFAELDVVERHCHGLTVAYVPLSQDAAIAEGYLDLVISNSYDTPIYIESLCNEGRLYFKIYGKETRADNRRIEYESVTVSVTEPPAPVETENPALKPGERKVTQNAMRGYYAELWKHVYIDGELVESIKVNTSNYSAAPEYVDVGPKPPEPKPEPTTEVPTTEAPTTEAPTTEAPTTEAPTAEAPKPEPTTEKPTTVE